jgi:pantetheine-phosphate adenylyltransferase
MKIRKAVYAGSFDPVTNGYLDIIKRASKIFDEVIVAIGMNPGKTPMFSADERYKFVHEATSAKKFGSLLSVTYSRKDSKKIEKFILSTEAGVDYSCLTERRLHGLDYSIIAAPRNIYEKYAKAIASEYIVHGGCTINEYVNGRHKFLKSTIESDVFLTDEFAPSEAMAQENMEWEIENLYKIAGSE